MQTAYVLYHKHAAKKGADFKLANKLTKEFMGIEEFFAAIRAKCSHEEEYVLELLKSRGFLLNEEELSLSDNAHPDDKDFLDQLLREENIGKISDDRIIISHSENMESIYYLYNKIEISAAEDVEDWGKFLHNGHAPKTCLKILEPFVARYIKAVSACGVSTWCSCDGNHPQRHSIHVNTVSGPNSLWHKIICQKILVEKFMLDWNKTYEVIDFDQDHKWKTYIELNRAAEYLYNNREKLRNIRQKASKSISNSQVKKCANDELSKLFYDEAVKLIDQQFA